MKIRVVSFSPLIVLCLALVVQSASGQVLYENGPYNGSVDAWTINFGYVVSDTFTLTSASTVNAFEFWSWQTPGDTALTVDWSITSAEFGGTTYGSGTVALTDTFLAINQYGYSIDQQVATGLNVALAAGTYWLNLQNATTSQGNPLFWDENSGVGCSSPGCPSLASESAYGSIPSESFSLCLDSRGCNQKAPPTPEPNTLVLLGSGALGIVGLLRRKLKV